jgi:hypothetical protein
MAQFPFQNAILKLESKKNKAHLAVRFFFFLMSPIMGMRTRESSPPLEMAELRRKITELVAQNAVPMVQQAIDAVREEGQYQAMKYLFEMIGLYPAAAKDESGSEDSLAQILLAQLGLPGGQEISEATDRLEKSTASDPVK